MTPWRIIEFAELDSTNRYACVHLKELQHGDVIQAAIQTSGRGRLNRSWVSHVPGNLCLSLVIKPDASEVGRLPLVNLSQLLALAACRTLDTFEVSATLKWPNDIQLGDRKLAGILAETVTAGTGFLGVVLGIGVNLNLDPKTLDSIDQPATALNQALGRAVDPVPFRDALLRVFFNEYDAFMQQGYRRIRDEFVRRCNFIGREIEVCGAGGMSSGKAVGVNEQGALVLLKPDGQSQIVEIGEMFGRA